MGRRGARVSARHGTTREGQDCLAPALLLCPLALRICEKVTSRLLGRERQVAPPLRSLAYPSNPVTWCVTYRTQLEAKRPFAPLLTNKDSQSSCARRVSENT